MDIQATKAKQTSIFLSLLTLALPTFGQLIAEPTFVVIDTAMVGHISTEALAGLSLGSSIFLTVIGTCIFLAYGATARVSQLFGAQKQREGLQTGIDSIWLATIIGIVIAITMIIGAPTFSTILGGQGNVITQSTWYLQTVSLGAPAMLIVFAANGIFRGMLQVNITLIAAIIGAIANTILDALFIFVFHWSIIGSGIATAIAQWIMGLILLVTIFRWVQQYKISLRPSLHAIRATAADTLPLCIRTIALRATLLFTVVITAKLGTNALASYQAVNATWNFTANALDALGIATQSLIGTALGKRDIAYTRILLRTAQRSALLFGTLLGIVFITAGITASSFFSPNPQIAALITVGMAIQGIFFPLESWMWMLDGVLIGAGDFIYLAITCSIASICTIATLQISIMAYSVIPLAALSHEHIQSVLMNIGLSSATANAWTMYITPESIGITMIWTILNCVLMGGRGIANGARIHGTQWMSKQLEQPHTSQ